MKVRSVQIGYDTRFVKNVEQTAGCETGGLSCNKEIKLVKMFTDILFHNN